MVYHCILPVKQPYGTIPNQPSYRLKCTTATLKIRHKGILIREFTKISSIPELSISHFWPTLLPKITPIYSFPVHFRRVFAQINWQIYLGSFLIEKTLIHNLAIAVGGINLHHKLVGRCNYLSDVWHQSLTAFGCVFSVSTIWNHMD